MRGKAEQGEPKPKPNRASPWPGIVFLIVFMLCVTAIVVTWIVAG